MGLFSRLFDVFTANLNALLDRAENPEVGPSAGRETAGCHPSCQIPLPLARRVITTTPGASKPCAAGS
jgi:hypothetical protein